jgi:hypothetical protein
VDFDECDVEAQVRKQLNVSARGGIVYLRLRIVTKRVGQACRRNKGIEVEGSHMLVSCN